MFERVFNRKNEIQKIKEVFVANFFADERHRWIEEDRYMKASMEELFEKIPSRFLKELLNKYPMVLVPSSGKFSCAVGKMKEHVIVLFPEVVSGLKSLNPREAQAIVAHEIGHIMNGHFVIEVDPLDAQVQADYFACDLGYLEEIESFLLDQPESVEKRVRLASITSRYFQES
jgi:predicted metal-dependent peptidase